MEVIKTKKSLRILTIIGLIIGALGVSILWMSGVEFPMYPPPGIIILLTGALFVGLVSRPWTPAIGAFMGLFVTVGFLISPTGIPNLIGDSGAAVSAGQAIQLIGVLTALVAGVLATSAGYRKK